MLDQPSPGISAIALCAGTGHWGMKGILFSTAPILPTFAASFVHCIKEGRKETLQHPWQPTRLNGWNSVCSLLHSLCSTNQTEEPCEPPARCSRNITSQAIIAGQGSVYAHNHCHKEHCSSSSSYLVVLSSELGAQHNKISRHQVVHLRCFKRGLQLTVFSWKAL